MLRCPRKPARFENFETVFRKV